MENQITGLAGREDDETSAKPDRTEKVVNSIGVFAPSVAFIITVILAWGTWLTLDDAIVFLILYFMTGFGVTIGLHRLLTHRAFKTYPVLRYFWAVLGALSLEGPIIGWVANHRKHHSFSDLEGDPHSPHHHGTGVSGAIKGLWHAHIGWLVADFKGASQERYTPDLIKDKGMVFISKHYLAWVIMSLLILPALLGLIIGGPSAILGAVLWGGIIRVFWLHHTTYSINSICHFFGRRKYETTDESRNVFWLAPFTFGESWHHNHHAFPTSAFHGLRWYEFDMSGLIIRGMRRLHLVWNVIEPSEERKLSKLAK